MGCLPVVRASLGRVTRAALLRLGRGSTGECPHLAERQLTSGHSIGDEWQMLECTSGPDLLLRRVACDTDLPCEPLPARREAFALPVPVSIRMEPRAGDLEAALQNVSEREAVLDAGGIDRPRLLHGFRATAWPLIEEAARRGYDTRAGLEDTFEMPDGSTASDNGEIVAEAARWIAVPTANAWGRAGRR